MIKIDSKSILIFFRSTMEQLEKRDSEFARILHMVLQRVQEIQTEGVDVVAARL